ncbi:MAG: MAPEG family protein [Gammaproteobacteria bacterium]
MLDNRMEWVAIVTALMLLQYIYFTVRVGKARGESGIKAPATSGDPVFERHFRVQQNTLEQLVVSVPALWMFGWFVDARIAALLGVIYVIGRFMFQRSYVADPATRGAGFLTGMLATLALLIGSLVGPLLRLF